MQMKTDKKMKLFFPSSVHSYHCRCDQKPVSCVPTDKLVQVVKCDNTNSEVASLCKYIKQIGTTFTGSLSTSMGIDQTIKDELTDQYFETFSVTLGVSQTTSYNWNQVSTEAKNEVERIEISADLPAGMTMTIYQPVGDCGSDGYTQTEQFDIYTSKKGSTEEVLAW